MEWYNIAQKGQVRDTDKKTVCSTTYNQDWTALHHKQSQIWEDNKHTQTIAKSLIHDL